MNERQFSGNRKPRLSDRQRRGGCPSTASMVGIGAEAGFRPAASISSARTPKMGERTPRRLLSSSAVVLQASTRGAPAGSWLEGMLARKPRMLVTVRWLTSWRAPSGRSWSSRRITELRSQRRRKPTRIRGVGGRSRSKEGVAQQSARRGRKNQQDPSCPRARDCEMIPVRELPYGPAVSSLHRRPDRWQHPTTCHNSPIPLATEGASTDGS